MPVPAQVPVNIQPKLAVNNSGDVYEQEADRISEHVMRMSEPELQRTRACGAGCPTGQTKQLDQEPDRLQTKRIGSSDLGQASAPAIVHEVLRSAGQPLDTATRAFFEPRFGHDFSHVRVHTDSKASESARSVNALAYTAGSSIVFRSGLAPHTVEGRRLLAHELAHVIQQGRQPRMIQRELYYAGGYQQRAFANDKDEMAAARRGKWFPATRDMAATAAGSGGGEAVSTVADLLTKIESKKPGSITRLNLIGHSSRSSFSFGGKITKDNVTFYEQASINVDTLKDHASRIAGLRDRFAKDATIVLYGCNAGAGLPLLTAVSNAFGVCVEGFIDEIWWCIEPGGKNKPMNRGRVWVVNRNDPVPTEEHPEGCSNFAGNITTLPVSQTTCAGVPKVEPEKKQ